jgi:hypothetical protein
MPYMGSSGNNTVDAMGQFAISGNVTPMEWYKTILRENGKPYLLAITILSDIVYWFRPTEVRDERTGQVIGWKKKFSGDMLQKSYKQYENLFGESRRSIKAAFDALVDLGVVIREFRDVKVGEDDEKMIYNVMFLNLNVERLNELTYPEKEPEVTEYASCIDDSIDPCMDANAGKMPELREKSEVVQNNVGGGTKFCMTSPQIMYEVVQNNAGGGAELCMTSPQNNVVGGTSNCRTNTEITTENTSTENISSISVSYPIKANDMCRKKSDADTDVDIDELTAFVDQQIDYDLLHIDLEQVPQEEYCTSMEFNNILDEVRRILVYEVFAAPDDKKFNFGSKEEPDFKSNAIVKNVFVKYLGFVTVKSYIVQYLQSSTMVKNVTMYHIKSLYRQCLTQSSQYMSGGRSFYARESV